MRETPDSTVCDDTSPRPLAKAAEEPTSAVLSYCVFDGLQWESTRGLGRFAAQLQRHLERTGWRGLTYPRPQWRSPLGRVILNQIVEPVWLQRLQPQIAIYPHNVLPAFFPSPRTLRILVLHDVLFLAGSNRNAGNRYRSAQLNRSLANADLVLTVSEASRAEVLRLLPDDTQVMVLPNALAASFERVDGALERRRAGPERILHFGGHASTKNTRAVFEAVASLKRKGRNVHLVLAAMAGAAEIVERWRQETGLPHEALTVLSRLGDEGLRRVYAEASVHCMPSTGEGFGIPVIESARCGTVNVLSPLPVFREIIGGDAIFADSFAAESIARALEEALVVDVSPIAEQARVRTDRFLFESVHRLDAVPIFRTIETMARSRSGCLTHKISSKRSRESH